MRHLLSALGLQHVPASTIEAYIAYGCMGYGYIEHCWFSLQKETASLCFSFSEAIS